MTQSTQTQLQQHDYSSLEAIHAGLTGANSSDYINELPATHALVFSIDTTLTSFFARTTPDAELPTALGTWAIRQLDYTDHNDLLRVLQATMYGEASPSAIIIHDHNVYVHTDYKRFCCTQTNKIGRFTDKCVKLHKPVPEAQTITQSGGHEQ